jgi:hypothetical protein
VTTSLGPAPSYCSTHLVKVLSPSQWATCWKYGWDEPTTNLMSRLGYDFGHNVLPVLIVLAIIAVLLLKGTTRL